MDSVVYKINVWKYTLSKLLVPHVHGYHIKVTFYQYLQPSMDCESIIIFYELLTVNFIDLLLMFKIVHGLCYFPPDTVISNTNHTHFSRPFLLQQLFCRTNLFYYSFIPSSIRTWNMLPDYNIIIVCLPSSASFSYSLKCYLNNLLVSNSCLLFIIVFKLLNTCVTRYTSPLAPLLLVYIQCSLHKL